MEINEISLKSICDKYDDCEDCPLVIERIIDADPDYDYNVRTICYKKKFEEIKRIEKLIKEEL